MILVLVLNMMVNTVATSMVSTIPIVHIIIIITILIVIFIIVIIMMLRKNSKRTVLNKICAGIYTRGAIGGIGTQAQVTIGGGKTNGQAP